MTNLPVIAKCKICPYLFTFMENKLYTDEFSCDPYHGLCPGTRCWNIFCPQTFSTLWHLSVHTFYFYGKKEIYTEEISCDPDMAQKNFLPPDISRLVTFFGPKPFSAPRCSFLWIVEILKNCELHSRSGSRNKGFPNEPDVKYRNFFIPRANFKVFFNPRDEEIFIPETHGTFGNPLFL